MAAAEESCAGVGVRLGMEESGSGRGREKARRRWNRLAGLLWGSGGADPAMLDDDVGDELLVLRE